MSFKARIYREKMSHLHTHVSPGRVSDPRKTVLHTWIRRSPLAVHSSLLCAWSRFSIRPHICEESSYVQPWTYLDVRIYIYSLDLTYVRGVIILPSNICFFVCEYFVYTHKTCVRVHLLVLKLLTCSRGTSVSQRYRIYTYRHTHTHI